MKINIVIPLLVFGAIAVAGSQNSDPLPDSKWKNVIGDKNSTSYTVKPGDTLSKISRDQLGKLDFWPKLWEVNRDSIHNPHLIEPDQKIIFSGIPGVTSRQPSSENPLGRKKKDDGLTDQLIRAKLAHQHRLRYLILEREEVLGIITGSYDTKNLLGVESKIYIGPMNKSRFVVGKRYAVVRETKGPVINKIDSKKLSQQLIQIIGEIEVESFGSEFVRAAIVSAYDMIERGDRIMDIPAVSMQDPPQTPPKQLVSKVLVGDSLDNDLFVEGQMLVLDKGFSNGMQLGYLFHVFDDTDPVLKEQSLIEPRSKGEVKIVHVSRYSSVGYIQKSREGIEVGDILLSHAELPNPVVPFTKSRPKVLIE